MMKILFMIITMLGIPVMAWAGEDVPTVANNAEAIKGVQTHVDYVWTLVAAALVFLCSPDLPWWRPDSPVPRMRSIL